MFACAKLRLTPHEQLLRAEYGKDAVPPQVVGLGATLTPEALHIKRLWVPRESRAKTLSFFLYEDERAEPVKVQVRWPSLERGRFRDVELYAVE
jgi:hypothetical protein